MQVILPYIYMTDTMNCSELDLLIILNTSERKMEQHATV